MQTITRGSFRRFLAYVRPYTAAVVLASLGGIVKFTVPLFVPQVTRYLIDHVFNNRTLSTALKLHTLLVSVGILVAIYLFVWVPFTYMRHYYAGKAGNKSVFDLRCDLYYHILRMSNGFFNRTRSGGIVGRMMSDTALAQNLVGSALTNIWIDGASIFVIGYFLFAIDLPTALVALVTFPAYILFFKRIGGKIKSTSHEIQRNIELMSGEVQEKVSGNVIVRAFTREKHEEHIFNTHSTRLLTSTMRSVFLQSWNMAISGLITGLAPLFVTLYGGYRVIHGDMTIGDLVAIGMYLPPLYLPLQRFSELNVVFSSSMAGLSRIFEIMDQKPEITSAPDAIQLTEPRGNITFDRVDFCYDEGTRVLTDLSFTVPAGRKIALVGRSGSGKSTIASLIPRFYDVTSGSISIDGHDLRTIDVKSLRSNIGMVLQEPVLFSGTIRDNIRYGRPDAPEQDILAACRMANAYEFITGLPAGLDTEIGERGVFISGGQKQRLTIARAFLKDPRILILDEATSALDSESETLIQDALERLMEGRSTIIIAHRLSTIMGVDQILVLRDGRLVEQGTHKELLDTSTVYRSLYDFQFANIVNLRK